MCATEVALSISKFEQSKKYSVWATWPWKWRQYDPLNHQEFLAQWHSVTPQKTPLFFQNITRSLRVNNYQHLGEAWCLHLQGIWSSGTENGDINPSRTLVTIYKQAHNDVLEDWTLNTAHIHILYFFSSPCTEWLWSPLSLLFCGYQHSLLAVKQLGRIVNHSPPACAEV